MNPTRARHLHAVHAGHWAGNLGDSAVFDVLDRALPSDVRLTMEVESLGDWRRRPQTSFIQWQDRKGVEQALRECDEVIIPGTTIVADLHAGEWPIAWIVKSIDAARSHGRKIHAVGVGIYASPQESRSDRFVREFAAGIEEFSVRDSASRDALLAAGVSAERITLGADLAWLLDRSSHMAAARAEMQQLTGGRPALAVNVVHEDWTQNDRFYQTVAADLDAIHDATGMVTVFLCNEIREGEFYDAAAVQHVMRSMKTPAMLYPVRWMHPEEMIARLACCACAVSMRYHFAIFAAMAEIPWVGFARGEKNRSLLAEFGRPASLAMGNLPRGRLAAEVLSVLERNKEIISGQSRTVHQLQHRAELCRDHLRRICFTSKKNSCG